MEKVLVTWFNSSEKANIFCDWVASHYSNRKSVIEKDNDCYCYWIYVYIKKEDLSVLQLATMLQAAIYDCPQLAKH